MKSQLMLKGKTKIFLAITIFLIVNVLLTGIATATSSIKNLTWSTGGFGGKPYLYSAAVAIYINRSEDVGEIFL